LILAIAAPGYAWAASPSPSPSPSSSPSAGQSPGNVTYGLGPSTKGKLDLRTGYTLLSTRGGTIKDEVGIVNLSLKPLTLNLYAVDAANGPDGELGLQPAAADLADAAKWVSFKTPTGKDYVRLKPKQTLFVPFTVKIPKDAPVGDHVAGVVLSTVTVGQTPGERASSVTLEQRVALRMAVRVAGELKPTLAIEDVQATYAGSLNPLAGGIATVTYTVRNTGNVRLGGAPKVTVSGLVGSSSSEALADVPMLLPGGTATLTATVADVKAAGLLTATVEVTPLVVAGDANPPTELASSSVRLLAVPWLLLAFVLLLVLMVLIWLRRRNAAPQSRGSSPRRSRVAEPVG
jgi:hypothetical protein